MVIIVAKSLNHGEQSRSAIRTENSTRIKTRAITTTKILSFIFAGILFFSSIENANMTTHAQLSSRLPTILLSQIMDQIPTKSDFWMHTGRII